MSEVYAVLRQWLWSFAILCGVVVASRIVLAVALRAARRVAARRQSQAAEASAQRLARPSAVALPLVAILLVLPLLPLDPASILSLRRFFLAASLAGAGWMAVALVDAVADLATSRLRIDVPDNLLARRAVTRIRILRHVLAVSVLVVTVAVVLMTFPGIRGIGASILASAGIAGLIVGMAARPTLENLIAGLQLAFTAPIQIDDVVVVEGQSGRIEEIGSAFVVVKLWDLRRLVVPLSHFIQKPIENWTRVSADLLGTVHLHVDYGTPVEAVRSELLRTLEDDRLWDGKVWALQVTDASEHTMELRALMSAANSSALFDLRCRVRERLIGFLQRQHPESLPRRRAEVWTRPERTPPDDSGAGGSP